MNLGIRRSTFPNLDHFSAPTAARVGRFPKRRGALMTDSLFDASPVAQCLLDRAMRFAAVNTAMSAILEAPAQKFLGRPASSVMKGAGDVIRAAFDLAQVGRTIPQRTIPWRDRHYTLSFNPVRDFTGRVDGLLVAAVDVTRQWRIERKLRESRRKLLTNSQHDHLTGLLNRRGLETKLNRELRRARRERGSVALLLVDVDAFKSFNDTFGHGAGDRCLEVVAAQLRACLRRPMDAACRYGGEEFAVILPGIDAAGAAVMAESCRKAVEDLKIAQPTSAYGQVTISIGVAAVSPAQDRASTALVSSALLDAADGALYRAKAAGRNLYEMA